MNMKIENYLPPKDLNWRPYGYIYTITNKVNGKQYVGQTTQELEDRWKDYKKLRCKKQPKIYRALLKYGIDNFIFEQIDTAPDQIVLDYLEDFYCVCLDTIENGYNCKGGGYAGKHSLESRQRRSEIFKGRVFTEEWKTKISEAKRGNKNASYGKKPWNYGKEMSEEQKQKISIAHKNKKESESSIQKRTLALRELYKTRKGPRFGHKHSEETKRKISNSLIRNIN